MYDQYQYLSCILARKRTGFLTNKPYVIETGEIKQVQTENDKTKNKKLKKKIREILY